MGYKLVISERAERHIDNIIHYVVNTLKNTGAAEAILSDIDEAYNRLEYMAEIHGYCNDYYLAKKGYRKIILSNHNYLIIYRVEGKEAHISGVFHMKEEYAGKL